MLKVAINDLADNKTLAHLLKYDSNYGIWDKDISADDEYINVGGKKSDNGKIAVERFGVEKALMTTVHGYTQDQMLQDGPLKDLERAREYFSNIHINTDLRVAYSKGIKKEFEKTSTPYKYLAKGGQEMKKTVEKYIKLFNSFDKV